MGETLPFNEHVYEYEQWFSKYPAVFKSEIAAIKQLLPDISKLKGIEIGVGTGRFAKKLGICAGVDPSKNMRAIAETKGIRVLNAKAEKLPYKSLQFDYVLINFCISYFENIRDALAETYRVLKPGGTLVVGFLEKNSEIGRMYQQKKNRNVFYTDAKFFTVDQITRSLKQAGFRTFEFRQTLFHPPDEILSVEVPQTGYGKGSYIFIKALK